MSWHVDHTYALKNECTSPSDSFFAILKYRIETFSSSMVIVAVEVSVLYSNLNADFLQPLVTTF